MKPKSDYKALGLMSGTSLDGVDVASCTFTRRNARWSFKIEKAETHAYSKEWVDKLANAHKLPATELLALDAEYGKFLGETCKRFIKQNKIRRIDLIASHGHTIFHQPRLGFTFQIGSGGALHAVTGLPVVCDFRSQDVAL